MNFGEFEEKLKAEIEGEVRFDEGSRALYATDASNYRQPPIGVVIPKSRKDILKTFELCRAFGLPVLSRGGGTSLAGQCCNSAVVLDYTKYYNRLLELNAEEGWARVEPGIVLDELRNAAEKHELTFGPDPATHSRCSLGGMMGNNSCGVHSPLAGRTSDNVLELEVLLYDGTVMKVGKTSEAELERLAAGGGREGDIYRGLKEIRDEYGALVRERYPDIPRRVSGYNLDELLPEAGFDLAKALIGSEGTCVCILEAKLRLVKSPQKRGLAVMGFSDLYAAAAQVPLLMKQKPIGLEGLDDILISHMRRKHLHEEDLPLLPKGKAWLLVEVGADSEFERDAQLESLRLLRLPGLVEAKVIADEGKQKRIWEIRESGLGATAFVPGEEDAWEGWEDSAVPPEKLAGYLKDFRALTDKYGYKTSLYGHFGQGCVHCRISFDFVTEPGIEAYHRFTEEAARLVTGYGGSLSGEHGDGQSRGELLPIMFGPEIVEAFQKFKALFDPENKMNPGKVVKPFKNTENLRLGKNYQPWDPKTFFRFPEDRGSFARAALRCVGVGACRQHKGGVMCPSYQATREEKHSTRGRARLLFEMMEGEVIPSKWRNKAVKEALDLCLSCKGCKGECPVNVDMATYKAEFLHHYYKGRLRPRHAYTFGFIGPLSRLAGRLPDLVNFLTQTKGLRALAKWFAGVHQEREIPRFEPSFRGWFEARERRSGNNPVILWPDTFNNHFHTSVARSAVKVLEAAGFQVSIPKQAFCCGRPLYDFGFLPTARRWLEHILEGLQEEIRSGIPIVFLEPSCAAVFRDELGNLLPNNQDAIRLRKQSFLLSEFLLEKAADFEWPRLAGKALVQGHCHQRSVLQFDKEKQLLEKICGSVEVVDGCCGMAGAFGFEKEKYAVSQAIGSQAIFPKVNGAGEDVHILANGFSCREQIRQGTGKEARHLAELLELALAAGARPKKTEAERSA
jgi:FAD/FMN-containing dehydrogenase/Fe-S oxidoreductase